MCTGLVQLLHLQPERLAPHMHDIIEYMLESTQVRMFSLRRVILLGEAERSHTPRQSCLAMSNMPARVCLPPIILTDCAMLRTTLHSRRAKQMQHPDTAR